MNLATATKADLQAEVKRLQRSLDRAETKIETLDKSIDRATKKITTLSNKLHAKNVELTEARTQQTVTAEILKVISSSPTDTRPVFDAIVGSGSRLFGGAEVGLNLRQEGELASMASNVGRDAPTYARSEEDESFPGVRAMVRREVVDVPDFLSETWVNEHVRERVTRLGRRAVTHAPLLSKGKAIGTINVSRVKPGPLAAQQVALLKTFADQAVIAIENVQLFRELETRNAALTQALERQTATSEILSVISRTPTDVTPVFETILKNAVALCGSPLAAIVRFDGELVHLAATHGWPQEALAETRRLLPGPPNPALISGRVILSGRIVRESDALADPDYDHALAEKGRWRRVLGVPLLHHGKVIGVINLAWADPGETPEQQVELLQTFASQAVIAIENARLFNETKEALERQTATTEILKVISNSPTDVQPVFDTIAASALRLCEGSFTLVTRFDGALIHIAALSNLMPEAEEVIRSAWPAAPGRANTTARCIAERQVMQIPDIYQDPDYQFRNAHVVNFRSVLAVPLMREDEPLGAISIGRVAGHQALPYA